MTQSRDVRIECALAMQYSDAWILTHIGGTVADITRAIERMDAADRGDNAAWVATLSPDGASEIDESVVEAMVAGTVKVARNRCPAELIEAISRLAERGCDDGQIGELIGRTREAVTKIRKRRGIPAGAPCTPNDMAWHKIWKPGHRRVCAARVTPKNRAIIGATTKDEPRHLSGASTPSDGALTPDRRG